MWIEDWKRAVTFEDMYVMLYARKERHFPCDSIGYKEAFMGFIKL